jgi:hypothetical protein
MCLIDPQKQDTLLLVTRHDNARQFKEVEVGSPLLKRRTFFICASWYMPELRESIRHRHIIYRRDTSVPVTRLKSPHRFEETHSNSCYGHPTHRGISLPSEIPVSSTSNGSQLVVLSRRCDLQCMQRPWSSPRRVPICFEGGVYPWRAVISGAEISRCHI